MFSRAADCAGVNDEEGEKVKVKVKMTFAALVALMGAAASAASEADIAAFREARFGMFIHWGLYAQLGGRWQGRKMDTIGEWVQSYFRIPNAEYASVAKNFNPVKFNADEWARQAKDAGMEYVILTTKHHDGFSMFGSKVDGYNVVDATPFGRDVFGELASACRRQGLKVGLYYSQALDWHEEDAADPIDESTNSRSSLANHGMDWGNSWDFPDVKKKDLHRYLEKKVCPQLKELLMNYGDIFVVWFDCPRCLTPEDSRRLLDFVHSISPHTLVNSRVGNGLGDFGSMGDNQMVASKGEFPLESPITLNSTWGFKYDDHAWKTGYDVSCRLARTISRGANMLLNVGPRPDGVFPDATSDVLAELGVWRRKTGFEILGAGASPFGQDFPWGWCTTARGNVLQLVVRSDWTNDLEVCGIRNEVKSATQRFEKHGDVLTLHLPPASDCMPRVVRIELDGAPDVDPRLMPQCGELLLTPAVSERIEQGRSDAKCRIARHGAFTDWHHPGDAIVWKAYFPAAGSYRLWLRTETWAHSRPWAGDRKVEVKVGDVRIVTDLQKDRDLNQPIYAAVESMLGEVEVPAKCECEIVVRTLDAGNEARYLDLTVLRLEKVFVH